MSVKIAMLMWLVVSKKNTKIKERSRKRFTISQQVFCLFVCLNYAVHVFIKCRSSLYKYNDLHILMSAEQVKWDTYGKRD